MRRKSFTLWERVVLIPVELVGALKGGLLLFIVLFLIGLFGGPGGLWVNTRYSCIYSAQIIITGMLAGAVFTPLLLPWLPGRAFSVKGLAPGILGALFLMVLRWGDWTAMTGAFEMIAGLLLILAASTFLAMNFTGASTYTSLSGVKKEMRWAVPLQAGSAALGFLFFIVSRFIA
jgi:acetyl-CoA decarbonylase/synthase complex subunit gamma